MKQKFVALFLTSALVFGAWAYSTGSSADDASLTKEEVLAAQQAWGAALVQISKTYEEQGIEQAKKLATEIIDKAYGYQTGVLFKPTLTVVPQTFRSTKEGALAYFVGHNENYAQDPGFALNPWRSVEIDNAGVMIYGNVAHTMGKVRITDKNGSVTEVDKTWAFKKDDAGDIRIVLHHSSLPYTIQ